MKKNKKFKNYILLAISGFFIVNCQSQLPNTSSVNQKASPVSTATTVNKDSEIKTLKFSNRKEALAFLQCLISNPELSDGKPSLLGRDIDNMEKAKPAIPDKQALETYTKYVNDIMRLYATAFKGCNNLKYQEV